MRRSTVSPLGAALIVVNWILAAAILLEYVAVQELLRSVDANWQDEFDSGTMAFASIPVVFGLLPPVVAAAAALAGLALGRVRPTAVGWTALVAHLALVPAIWNGSAAPGSAMGYWVRLAVFTGWAATGIVAGANLRPISRPTPQAHAVGQGDPTAVSDFNGVS